MGKKPYPLAGKKETEGQEKISCSEKDGKQRHKFSLMLFPTEPQNKDKLLELHKKVKDRKHLLVKFGLSGASLEDLRSLLPPEYLTMEHDAPTAPLPWLTDDVVNCRIAQLAQGNEKVKILPTYVFVCWWRDWHTLLQISDRTLEWSLKDMQSQCTVLFPRCVGGKTPEKGNHFILWVFDGAHKEIRIYDSMQYHSKIDKTDMEILRFAFQSYWNLDEWSICFPSQWFQSDQQNCGVFVCTMAEMEVRGMFVETETLKMPQLKYLRQYHATSLIKDGVIQVKKSRAEVCMAAALHVCTFQKLAVEGSLYPEVTVLSWVQCDHCNGWLHTDCAGVQEKSLKGSFNCGCQLPLQRSFDRTRVALQQKGIGGLIEDSGIV
ncbi:uncharacterized protein [Paramormyrops kingsleyae]